ncbi:AraC family transcriptional regulator [Variovorax sp. WS11]|uniref:AraC family transcriptional regulator n=1 Tax=Variovorax sp. WS11 TaxID=1105204 RepID=UPI0015E6EDF9|nr:AraC family transcriptional regulator [Variovorax sp. WS11]
MTLKGDFTAVTHPYTRPLAQLPLADERVYLPYKIATLVDTLAEAGVDAARTLERTGLQASDLRSTALRTSIRQFMTVCRNGMAATGDPALPFRAGTRMHVSSYGMYGYALLCCETLREVTQMAVKFHRLATPTVALSFREEDGEAVWTFDDVLDLGPDDALHRFFVEFQYGIHQTLARDMVGPDFKLSRLRARYPRPEHAALYGVYFDCPIEFDQPDNELRYPAALLDKPAAYRNSISVAMAAEVCERMLVEAKTTSGLTRRVYNLLMERPGQFDDMEALARKLNTSSRTLRRHLTTQGTSYKEILDDVRCHLAKEYLRSTRMGIDDIASTLGFSDAANFRHAFRRWTHKSPSDFRR